MTTKLKGEAAVSREVVGNDGVTYRITLKEDGVYMREKGRRGDFGPLSYGYVYLQLGKQAAIARMDGGESVTRNTVKKRSVSRGLLTTLNTLASA